MCVAVLSAVLLSAVALAQPIADAKLDGEADKVFKTGSRYPDPKLQMDRGTSDTIKRLRRESIDRRFRLQASKETALDSNPPAGFNPAAAGAASVEQAQMLFARLLANGLGYWTQFTATSPAGESPTATLVLRPPFDDWGMATSADRGALAAAIADPALGAMVAMSASSSSGMRHLADCLVWVEKAFAAPATGNMTVRVGDGGKTLAEHDGAGFIDDGTQPWQNYQATRLKTNWVFACHPGSSTWREQMSPWDRGRPMLPPIRVNEGDPVLVGIGIETYVCTRYGAVATALCAAATAPIIIDIR